MTTNPKTPAPRRTNAERSAATRGRLIEAAVDILVREGYSSTTTIAVADVAKVSRGAMLHHFPTRTDMLIAVAEHLIKEQSRLRRMQPTSMPLIERFLAANDLSWELQKQPVTMALLEIMMAGRSDPDLQTRLQPLVQQVLDLRQVGALRLATALGIDETVTRRMVRVHLACLRGLAIDLMFTKDPAEVEIARRLFRDYEQMFLEQLLAKAKKS
jgi:AcrR family transcriptional regulator